MAQSLCPPAKSSNTSETKTVTTLRFLRILEVDDQTSAAVPQLISPESSLWMCATDNLMSKSGREFSAFNLKSVEIDRPMRIERFAFQTRLHSFASSSAALWRRSTPTPSASPCRMHRTSSAQVLAQAKLTRRPSRTSLC
jgi:hypothetical protein